MAGEVKKYTLEKEEDRAAAKRWVEALRSGEYEQTCDALAAVDPGRGPCFCCLGVLADLEADGAWDDTSDVWDFLPSKGGTCTPYLTVRVPSPDYHASEERCVVEWLPVRLARVLATLNDEGQTFAEIADYAEKALL